MRRLFTFLAIFAAGVALIAHCDGVSASESVERATDAQSVSIDRPLSAVPTPSSPTTHQVSDRPDALAAQQGQDDQSPAVVNPLKSFVCGACSLLNYANPVEVCPFCHIDDEPNPID